MFLNKTLIFVLCFFSAVAYSEKKSSDATSLSRSKLEALSPNGKSPFWVSLYKPNYVMPFYYNPQQPSSGNTPDGQALNPVEIKFQLSFDVPLLTNVFSPKNRLYVAYTQQSYWQAYNHSAFFRETNYEPELFLSRVVHQPIVGSMDLAFLNVGLVHQSNGQGGMQERSWNRFYTEFIFSNDRWLVEVKPWFIFPDSSFHEYNPDMRYYMGDESITTSYKLGPSTISLMMRNFFESGFQRGGAEFSWSIPLAHQIRFYTQAFYGYGQSLIDYNHRTASVGAGFSLNDLQ